MMFFPLLPNVPSALGWNAAVLKYAPVAVPPFSGFSHVFLPVLRTLSGWPATRSARSPFSVNRHTISAGMGLMHQWAQENTQYPTNAIVNFGGGYTGQGLADWLLGYMSGFQQGAGEIADIKGWQVDQRGYLAARNGEPAHAEAFFRAASQASPSYVVAWVNLAATLASEAKWPEAKKALDHALEIDPDNAEARQLEEAVDAAHEGP